MRQHGRIGGASILAVICLACGDTPSAPGTTHSPSATDRYRITGVVEEGGNQGFPITDAQVRLSPSGLTAVTDRLGTFAIPTGPTSTDAAMEISKDGYANASVGVPPVNGPAAHVTLHRVAPRADYAGSYTLTLGSDSCTQLPVALRKRTYPATWTQSWPDFEIRLTGDFDLQLDPSRGHFVYVSGNVMHGYIVRDNELHFWQMWGAGDIDGPIHPDIAERLPDGSFVVFDGQPSTTVIKPSGASGVISGGSIGLYAHGLTNSPSAFCRMTYSYDLTR